MPLLVYTLLRLVVLAVSAGALALLGVRGWLLALLALVIAALVSYLALAGPRRDAAAWLAARRERREAEAPRPAVVDADAEAEDAVVDAHDVDPRAEGPHAADPHDVDSHAADAGPDETGQSARPSPSSTP